jgi:hypothetical protein
VGQGAARALRGRGLDARYLAGGLERWRAEGNRTQPFAPPTRWVTRARPKIDRIACPWLVRRFIDPTAGVLLRPDRGSARLRRGERRDARTMFRMSVIRMRVAIAASMRSSACTVSIIRRSPSSRRSFVAPDTGAPELAREASGLLAVSLGTLRRLSPTNTRC